MKRSVVIYDGLWGCLCPSFDATLAQRASRLLPSRAHPARLTRGQAAQNRAYSAQASVSIDTYIQDMFSVGKPKHSGSSYSYLFDRKLPPTEQELSRATIDEIVESIHILRGREKPWKSTSPVQRHERIMQLVRHLIVARKQRLTAFLYECLMDAMGDPQGSGITVVNIMRDLSRQGIEPTAAFYNSALESLTVHPNYVALLEVLAVMRRRKWHTNRQTTALAYLRDEQNEMAYDTLMELHAAKTRVDPWVYDIFIFVFGRMGFLDEMLEILSIRMELRATESLDALQLFALDACSAAFHYPGTVAGWNALVRTGRVNPADGIVENVLDTAAREGDTALATEALDMLAHRTRMRDYHYDSLIDAFMRTGDLASVVRIYSIMHESGIPVTKQVVDRLVEVTQGMGTLLNSWLFDVNQEGRLLPQSLVDAAMAKQIAASEYDAAMDLFFEYEKLCGTECSYDLTLQLIRQCKDISTINTLCDKVLTSHMKASGETAMRMERFNSIVTELFADGRMTQAQACFDKLTERGLDTSGIERPVWWTLMA